MLCTSNSLIRVENMKKYVMIMAPMVILVMAKAGYCWGERQTHPAISESAVTNSIT